MISDLAFNAYTNHFSRIICEWAISRQQTTLDNMRLCDYRLGDHRLYKPFRMHNLRMNNIRQHTTTNNKKQPPTTTNNHQQPPTTTNNDDRQPLGGPTMTNINKRQPTTTANARQQRNATQQLHPDFETSAPLTYRAHNVLGMCVCFV